MAPWQSTCVNCSGVNKITIGDYPYKGWWETSPTWDWTKVTCNATTNGTTTKDGTTTTTTTYSNAPQNQLKTLLKNMKM